MQSRVVTIGIFGILWGAALSVAQVGTPQDSLRELEALRVEVAMTRNPGAARRGVDADFVRDTVEERLDQLDIEPLPDEEPNGTAYLSVTLNPARISDGFAVSLILQLFQSATLTNGETVMASTWHAHSLGISDVEDLQDYVRNALRNHLETLASAHRGANRR